MGTETNVRNINSLSDFIRIIASGNHLARLVQGIGQRERGLNHVRNWRLRSNHGSLCCRDWFRGTLVARHVEGLTMKVAPLTLMAGQLGLYAYAVAYLLTGGW
jgi:hypothetical protein